MMRKGRRKTRNCMNDAWLRSVAVEDVSEKVAMTGEGIVIDLDANSSLNTRAHAVRAHSSPTPSMVQKHARLVDHSCMMMRWSVRRREVKHGRKRHKQDGTDTRDALLIRPRQGLLAYLTLYHTRDSETISILKGYLYRLLEISAIRRAGRQMSRHTFLSGSRLWSGFRFSAVDLYPGVGLL